MAHLASSWRSKLVNITWCITVAYKSSNCCEACLSIVQFREFNSTNISNALSKSTLRNPWWCLPTPAYALTYYQGNHEWRTYTLRIDCQLEITSTYSMWFQSFFILREINKHHTTDVFCPNSWAINSSRHTISRCHHFCVIKLAIANDMV